MATRTIIPLSRRVMDKFTIDDGCWNWTGARDPGGYGRIQQGRRGGKRLHAHRVLYELLIGPIPDGLVIDHLCRNPSCVNPGHLEPVTQGENMKRGDVWISKSLNPSTHCKRGHELTEENVYMHSGWRNCRMCRQDGARKYRPNRSSKEKRE